MAYFDIPRADKRNRHAFTPDIIANAISDSPDGGLTVALSKKGLSEFPLEAARQLANHGRSQTDDECIIERITLGNNRLCTLPTEFVSLSRLRYLNLKRNAFTRFPDVIAWLPALDTLDISHNKISSFPAQPGKLLQLRVFSFARNKITRFPAYFPQFTHLEVLKLERNPIEWPPHHVIQVEDEADKDMGSWIRSIQEWIEYNASPHDDSGYGESIETHSVPEKQDNWQFPRRDGGQAADLYAHSRSLSLESSNASLVAESLTDPDMSTDANWRTQSHPPSTYHFESHFARDTYVDSPNGSDRFGTRPSTSQSNRSGQEYSQHAAHLRSASAAEPERMLSDSCVPPKQSLPDLRSPDWKSPESLTFNIPETPFPTSISQSSSKSIETQSDSTTTITTGHPSSMAFERNSYFQRLQAMPQAVRLPQPLLCLVETARSILFVTSQIYQTIEHYANNAIDEKHSAVFKRVLEPANADMVQLIRSLDQYDQSSRKGIPPCSICRSLVESCRNTVAVTHKAVGLFAIQLRIAPCEDFRYSRWILLELYASTAEISVAWQNLVPHSDTLKGFLTGRMGLLTAASDSHSNSPSIPTRSDSLYPTPRLRNADFNSVRTHQARRHAGSFSYRDVEIGKDLQEEPPSLPGRAPVAALRLAPKRQATAPATALGLLSAPGMAASKPAAEDVSIGRRRDDDPFDSHPTQSPLSSRRTPSRSRSTDPTVDIEIIQGTLEAIESIAGMWSTLGESVTSDPHLRDLLVRGRELSKNLQGGLRNALDNDCRIDSQSSEDVLVLFKIISQLAKNNSRHPALAKAHSQLGKVIQSLDGFVKVLHLPPTSGRAYSPAFASSFGGPGYPEDNRLSSSLSRARSAQGVAPLKINLPIVPEGARSTALSSAGFKVPTVNRKPSRDPWIENGDPG